MTLEEFDRAMCALKIQRSPHCEGEKMRRFGEREWIEIVNMNITQESFMRCIGI